jgi:Fe2+ or Zn2+ uptake regulation protein
MSAPPTTSPKRILRSAGRRVTGQRELLLEVIQAQPGHLDADELYRLARQRDPKLSLSTVYRTLRLLRDLGLVDELHLDEEHHHYEIKPAAAHHHLICLGCGQIVEFASPLTERLQAAVAREHDFEIAAARIDLTGYCAHCRTPRNGGRDGESEASTSPSQA